MPADSAGEDDAFEVASACDEVVDLVAVGDACDILLDDGAVVEDLGDVVAGSADELDSAGVCGVVGACADEGGEEGVVYVDDGGGVGGDEGGGEDLHVAGEDDEVDVVLAEEVELKLFDCGAVGLAG